MPFMYKPSLWGFTAATIFIILAIVEVQDRDWIDALMWGLLGVSFAIKYLPKFLIFSIQGSMASFITLIAGGAMFIRYAAQMLNNGG